MTGNNDDPQALCLLRKKMRSTTLTNKLLCRPGGMAIVAADAAGLNEEVVAGWQVVMITNLFF